MSFTAPISIFSSAKSNKPASTVAAGLLLQNIRNGVYRQQIAALRTIEDKKERDEQKKKLQAVTWAGTFTKRNLEGLEQYSGLICIDVDGLPPTRLWELRTDMRNDEYIVSFFVSPSGNGLKIIFHTDTPAEKYKDAWQSIVNYLAEKYGITVDELKDICRLCFVSYDDELHLNEEYLIVDDAFIATHAQYALLASAPKADVIGRPVGVEVEELLKKCHEIVQKTNKGGSGQWNKYINLFSLQANRYGIDQGDTLAELIHYCGDHDTKDTTAVVKNVYKNFSAENGKFLQSGSRAVAKKAKAPTGTNVLATKYNTDVLFWYGIKTGQTNEAGQTKIEYKYSYDDAVQFLENNGFYKYRTDNNRYQVIRVDKTNNHVEIVTYLEVKEFMIGFLKTDDSQEYKQVREMFRRGAKNYCSDNVLEGLEYYKPIFKRDTKDRAYVYFKNCFLEITAAGFRQLPYTELDGYIWKRQVKDADFNIVDFQHSDVYRFLLYAITGEKKSALSDYDELQKQKFQSVCTTIGYMLHRYKSPATTKAVVAVDKKLRSSGEANGRTGKSLLAKLIAKMMSVTMIDAPNFKFDYEFAFQKCNVDTEIVNFNDVSKNFDFYRLFGMITEEFTFSKKKIDSITMPFEDSPKFYISTNYTLKGDGESNKGRQQIIEFSNYFKSDYQPSDEFGHMFFSDWDAQEWHRFYSFMIDCVKQYLTSGLVPFPLENYEHNRLIDSAGEEFIEYMERIVITGLNPDTEAGQSYNNKHDAHVMFNEFVKEANKAHWYRINMFTKQVKEWAKINGLLVNDGYPDGRYKSNGVTYYQFTPDPKANTAKTAPAKSDKLPF